MKINKIIMIFLVILAVSACDIIEKPYTKNTEVIPDDTISRKVLIEDFTGFQCGNCPEASHKSELIVEQFKGRVIPIALHAGPLAIPTPIQKYEFRTAETKELAQYYSLSSTPYGLVNRTSYNKQTLLSPDSWGGAAVEQLNKPADVKITPSVEYDESTREISLDVTLKYYKNSNPNHFLAVYIVEDSIIQFQRDDRKFPEVEVFDFVHMNVMRGSFTGTWGFQVSSGEITAGAEKVFPMAFTIPQNKDWKPKDLSLVIFVHNNETKEILQVEEIKLMK